MQGSDESVSMLLKAGADPNKLDNLGRTLLQLAAFAYRVSAVIAMFEFSSNVWKIDCYGRSPIY